MKTYIDLDSTLTNFNQAVEALGQDVALGLSEDASLEQKQIMYNAIENAKESFWANMSWMPDGKVLWDAVKQYKPILLSCILCK